MARKRELHRALAAPQVLHSIVERFLASGEWQAWATGVSAELDGEATGAVAPAAHVSSPPLLPKARPTAPPVQRRPKAWDGWD